MVRKIVLSLTLFLGFVSMANAQVLHNLFPGSVITGTDNCCITNTTYLVFYPATAFLVTPDIDRGQFQNLIPKFQMTFTAPGTYNVDALALWALAPGTPFLQGVAIQATYHPKIRGQNLPTNDPSMPDRRAIRDESA